MSDLSHKQGDEHRARENMAVYFDFRDRGLVTSGDRWVRCTDEFATERAVLRRLWEQANG